MNIDNLNKDFKENLDGLGIHFTDYPKTHRLEITQKTLLVIAWSGAREVGTGCPFCGHENSIKTEDIIEETSFVCDSCKRVIKIALS